MNAISKRLLSWLCVIAMVLSFVPVMDLSGWAVTTKAAETEAEGGSTNPEDVADDNQSGISEKSSEASEKPKVELGGQNLSDAAWTEVDEAAEIQEKAQTFQLDTENKAECPACGKAVEWVEATCPGQKTEDNGKYHFYLDAGTVVTQVDNWAAMNGKNMTMCLMLLNGEIEKELGGQIGMGSDSEACTLNIMGNGLLTSDGTAGDGNFGVISIQGTNNTVNLYGGSFVYEKTFGKAVKPSGAALQVHGAGGHTINIFNETTIGPEVQDLSNTMYNVLMNPADATADSTLNIYGGTIRNGVSNHKSYSGNITTVNKTGINNHINIYGGTIENGSYVTKTAVTTRGGNIFAGAGSKLTIYGGTIRDGKATYAGGNIFIDTSSLSEINISGGTITGGKALRGGNIYVRSSVALNQYALVENGEASESGGNIYVDGTYGTYGKFFQNEGSEVRGGKANGDDYGGGNVFVNTSGTYVMKGGTVRDGYAKKSGGNIQCSGGDLTIGGTALIADGESVSHGGNIHVNNTGSALTISGGKIAGGTAISASTYGGSVYVGGCEKLTITGGIFDGGNSGGRGGNLYIATAAANKVGTISNATFQNGVAADQGGNISTAVSVTMESCTVADGIGRKGGGNINVSRQSQTLTLKNCTVYGGWVSGAKNADGDLTAPTNAQWGGNIRSWGSDVVIDGGLYHSGYRGVNKKTAHQGNNIACMGSLEPTDTSKVNAPTLTIGGDAIIVGDVNASGPSRNTPAEGAEQLTCAGTSIVLKDNPRIVLSYELDGGTVVKASKGGLYIPTNDIDSIKADISGLTDGADITIDGSAGQVISKACDDAENLAGYIKSSDAKEVIAVNTDNELYILACVAAIKKVDGKTKWYATNEEALDAYDKTTDAYVVLSGTDEIEINKDLVINVNGESLTLKGSGYNIKLIDTTNNDYDGNGTVTISEGVTVDGYDNTVNGKRYITLKDEDAEVYHAHRVEMKLTHVTLRTTEGGYYYKAAYQMDNVLANRIKGYGVVLSYEDMPGADFLTVETDKYTMIESSLTLDENHTATGVTSGSLWGILKKPGEDGRTKELNMWYAEMYVYANAYLAVDVEGGADLDHATYFMADTENAETTVQEGQKYAGVAHRFLDVLQGVNDNWENYDADKQELITETFETWINWIPVDDQTNVKALLPKIFPSEGE